MTNEIPVPTAGPPPSPTRIEERLHPLTPFVNLWIGVVALGWFVVSSVLQGDPIWNDLGEMRERLQDMPWWVFLVAGGVDGITGLATEYNARPAASKQSKFVGDAQIHTTQGIVTVTTAGAASGLPADARGMTLIFTPNVQGALIVPGVTGALDWACASTTNATATVRGLISGLGTLPAKYVPAECR